MAQNFPVLTMNSGASTSFAISSHGSTLFSMHVTLPFQFGVFWQRGCAAHSASGSGDHCVSEVGVKQGGSVISAEGRKENKSGEEEDG